MARGKEFSVYRHNTPFGAYDIGSLTVASEHFERARCSLTQGERRQFRLKRVKNPVGAIVIRRAPHLAFWFEIGIGPGAVYGACGGELQETLGVRFKLGEIRFYKLEIV